MARKREKFDARGEIKLLKDQMKEAQEQIATLAEAVRQSFPVAKLPASVTPKSLANKKKSGMPRGPKRRHSLSIFEERDFIVRLLETHWMQIEPRCGRWADKGLKLAKPPDMSGIEKILISLLNPSNSQIAETAEKLLPKLVFLETFLTDPKMRRRFSGDPKRARNRFGGDRAHTALH